MHKLKDINWEELYMEEYFSSPDCWKTCGSYCCKFNLLDEKGDKGVSLPLFPGEYEYWQSIGGISNMPDPARKRNYKLSNGLQFSTYFLTCKCVGLCNPHNHRPLICRFYPYFPVVNEKGEIQGYEYSSLTDIFYKNSTLNHPCTLVREKPADIQGQMAVTVKKILKYPQFIFSLMAAKIIIDNLRIVMNTTIDDLVEEELKKFYKNFEWTVFTARPWKNQNFYAEIQQAYDKVKSVYGEFEL